jgi:hypothetical protein
LFPFKIDVDDKDEDYYKDKKKEEAYNDEMMMIFPY